jgi:hypothetical protein
MQEEGGGGVVVVTWHTRGWRCGVVVGDMAHGVASSLVTWHSIIVVGDVGHERGAVMASSSVTWHARGCWGCVVVGGVAVERVVVVLTWHTKRPWLAATVTWRIVGLWMRDEVGGGGQQGAQLTWGNPFPGLLVLMLALALPTSSLSLNRSLLLSSNRLLLLLSCA